MYKLYSENPFQGVPEKYTITGILLRPEQLSSWDKLRDYQDEE